MKPHTRNLFLFGGGAIALFFLVRSARASSEGLVITLATGAIFVRTPSGAVHFALPAGAQGWAYAAVGQPGAVPTALAIPSGTGELAAAGVVAGVAYTFAWHDASGATQMAEVTFT